MKCTYKAVGSLPEIQRRRFLLYYEYEFNFYQIAGALHRFGNTEICCDCKGESKGGN